MKIIGSVQKKYRYPYFYSKFMLYIQVMITTHCEEKVSSIQELEKKNET